MMDKYDVKFLLTGQLNQDCLEIFFSVIRAKGGLHDHPSPLEFKYRFRSYLLGRNEIILYTEANVEPTQDRLVGVNDSTAFRQENLSYGDDDILSQNIFKQVFQGVQISPEEELELSERQYQKELAGEISLLNGVEFDGLENFGGYLISKMKLLNYGYQTFVQKDPNYAFVNILLEGGSTAEFMALLEKLNSIFVMCTKDHLIESPGFLQNLLESSKNVTNLDVKILKRFFFWVGRTSGYDF